MNPTERTTRAAIHKMNAHLVGLFPPAARRGRRLKDPRVDELFSDAVLLFDFNHRQPYGAPADAQEASEVLRGELERGIAEVDAEVFRTLARAAEHVRTASKRMTSHAAHVRGARLAAAGFLLAGETPTKQEVKLAAVAILKSQGRAFYAVSETAAWTPVLRDAGLAGLPKCNPGGTIKKQGKWQPIGRKKKPRGK